MSRPAGPSSSATQRTSDFWISSPWTSSRAGGASAPYREGRCHGQISVADPTLTGRYPHVHRFIHSLHGHQNQPRYGRGYVKCARIVGDVMGHYHPHGDSAIYDTLVRMAQPWSLRYPLIDGNGNFGSPGNYPAAAMRYTESRLAQLAMEMLRDIDEDTVDFGPNYHGRTQEPEILPARFPNLLVNGSDGIAVGFATKIPPHNLREIAAAVQWCLEHPDTDDATTLDELIKLVKGPDFPTGAL